jgi:SAM-dependent methyltransferase
MSIEPWHAFFDAHYLLTYAPLQPDGHSRAEALDAARLAGLTPDSRLLDVPCGFGRHAVALAREGYRVVGLDRSVTQLDEARRRRGAAQGPSVVRADYRQIPLASGTLDAALNLRSSLGYAARMLIGSCWARFDGSSAPAGVFSWRRTTGTGSRREARRGSGIPSERAPSSWQRAVSIE